jgi:hypothetical protein
VVRLYRPHALRNFEGPTAEILCILNLNNKKIQDIVYHTIYLYQLYFIMTIKTKE